MDLVYNLSKSLFVTDANTFIYIYDALIKFIKKEYELEFHHMYIAQ